ncbi:MAG: sulfatase [Candidatus Marinimicrobia bacterium]|nr:sulfatase [Candidatus Neomarinimicrobiota bacterium]
MSAKAERYNIVVMVADDHGREALGCYGNPVIRTPNMDALAADGTRFTNACCTSASCAASRSAILTGLHNHTNGTYGHTHGIHHFAAFDWVKSLPAYLNEAGYRTGRVGKKHYSPEAVYPFQWGEPDTAFGRDDVAAAASCREFLSGPDPFFLYWCSYNPHRSGEVLASHPCQPNRFGNPETAFPGDEETAYRDDEVLVPSFLSDTPEARAELTQYYQSISRLDRGIGHLIQLLKETGQYDRTLIIYISDNGAAFPASKTTLYDPGMRLPCLVRAPDQPAAGRVRDELVSWTDITPTVLDYAGVTTPPDAFFGASWRPLLQSAGPAPWRESVYGAHTFHEITNYYPMRVIRTQRYKFIWNIAHPLSYTFASDLWDSATWKAVRRDQPAQFGARTVAAYLQRPRFELYDLQADPDELDNLAERPEHQAQVEAFCEQIKDFQQRTKDPWFHKWEHE